MTKLHYKVDLNRTACGIRTDVHYELETCGRDEFYSYDLQDFVCLRCWSHKPNDIAVLQA